MSMVPSKEQRAREAGFRKGFAAGLRQGEARTVEAIARWVEGGHIQITVTPEGSDVADRPIPVKIDPGPIAAAIRGVAARQGGRVMHRIEADRDV